MSRVRRLVMVLAVLAAAAGLVTWLYKTGRIGARPPPPNELTLYGNVDIRQVELGFRVGGRIKEMSAEEGQPVARDAVIATLDTRALDDDLRAAQAEVALQDATLKKVVAGSRPAEIARARAQVDEATAAQENAHTELARTQKLVAQDTLPQAVLDNAATAARQADARVASSQESLRLVVQGSRQEDIVAARAAVDVSKAREASAQTAIDDARIKAPADGVVISRVREPGAIVSPSDVVYVVSLTKSVWVRAYVGETELGKLHPGMPADVLSDAEPGRAIKGHIGFISPTAEFTPKSVETPDLRTDLVYRLRVIVDEPDAGLRQGMPVTVRIHTGGG
jgi:HlyD family secretion protein